MRLLLDTCVASGVRRALQSAGHDVQHTADWSSDPGDAAILAFALEQNRVLVTLDKDFGELAIVRGHAHGGIVRLVALGTEEQARLLLHVIERHGSELEAGALVTADTRRLRIRTE